MTTIFHSVGFRFGIKNAFYPNKYEDATLRTSVIFRSEYSYLETSNRNPPHTLGIPNACGDNIQGVHE